MKNLHLILLSMIIAIATFSCKKTELKNKTETEDTFKFVAEEFADLKIIRYKIPQWDKLSLKQKKLVYYLTQAGLCGRDIFWDQNYRHNLKIRRALEKIANNYQGDKNTQDWRNFMIYTKRIWFSNGIHHHYSQDKFMPTFSKEYFRELLDATNTRLSKRIVGIMYSKTEDIKKINLDPKKDLVKGSAVNFYAPTVTEREVNYFYKRMMRKKEKEPISYGLNSKIVKERGRIKEKVWKLNGMYGAAIKKIIYWLEKAVEVAENEPQAKTLRLLIEYYKSGDLKKWDEYSIAWTEATKGDIDYINGFIEVYDDPKGYKAAYESIVQINDFEMSERMAVVAKNAQWFENNSPIKSEHKKTSVVGISYKVVNVAGEAGATSPSTPIGVNLPNANWIRAKHGSKSVSLGNIIYAYGKSSGNGILNEFSPNKEIIERSKKHAKVASKMHTALHEVIGHASGKMNKGVATPKETLKNYSSPLEELRADLVALYYLMDEKLVNLGLMESIEVGKASYDRYIRNGIMTQLIRIKLGKKVEQAHMRSRKTGATWIYEKGKKDKIIEKITKEGKTYFLINDYDKLREIFGDLLREVQRIKSEGDYTAGRNLIENYGVNIDKKLHKEVLERSKELNIKPYGGFINPRLVPVMEDEKITDIKVEYPDDFTQQMLEYAEKYSFLPDMN